MFDSQEQPPCFGDSHRWSKWQLATGVSYPVFRHGMPAVLFSTVTQLHASLHGSFTTQAVPFAASQSGYPPELPSLCFILWISDCNPMDQWPFQSKTVLLYLTSMRFLKALTMISLRRTYSAKYHRLHHSLLPSRQPTQILKALEEGKALSSYLPIPLSNQRYLASISFLRDDLNLWLMGIHVPIAKEGLLFIYEIFEF